MNCPTCGTVMKPLFTGSFCPNNCDKKQKTPKVAFVCPPELLQVGYVVGRLGTTFGVYVVEPPATEWDPIAAGYDPVGMSLYYSPTTPTGYADLSKLQQTVTDAHGYWGQGNHFGIPVPEIGASFVGAGVVHKNCILFIPHKE